MGYKMMNFGYANSASLAPQSTKLGLRRSFSKTFYLCSIILSALVTSNASAQQQDDFYLPLPESQALEFFDDINTDTGANLFTRTDIVIREDNTTVIWDDASVAGYESQYTNSAAWDASTEIWGDGDCANGFAPGTTCSVGTDDVLTIGQVIVLDQTQASAQDYFLASNVVNLTRSFWPETTSTLLAGAFELFPTEQWGTSYVVPIGEDTASDGSMFEQVALTVIAEQDGTVVAIDPDGPTAGDGVSEIITLNLDRGDTGEVGLGPGGNGQTLAINEGATVTSNFPVQVNVLTGDIGSNYEARFYTLFPNALLSSEYYEAVTTTVGGDPAAIFLYNPNSSAITVNYFDNEDPTANPTAVPIAANSGAKIFVPGNTTQGFTGLKLETAGGEVFTAYTVIDDGGEAHDWGHVTTPLRLMGNIVRVGFAPGRDPEFSDANPANDQNASPVWLIADVPGQGTSQDIEICIDAGGDGGSVSDLESSRTADYSIIVQPLDSARIYNNGAEGASSVINGGATLAAVNNNGGTQTGTLAFACDTVNSGSPVADPDDVILAAAWGQDPLRASAASPGFDVGTTIRTGSDTNLFVGDLVFNDVDADGIQDIGEPGISGVDVTISTTNPAVDVDPTTAGIQSSYTIQTDANGVYLFTNLSRDEDYTITVTQPGGFTPVSDPDGILDNANTFTLASSTLTKDFGYSTGLVGDQIYYDIDGDGVYEPGDGEQGIAGVEVQACYDSVGSVFASDSFDARVYNGGTGFISDWVETDFFGGGATGGEIQVTNPADELFLFGYGNNILRTVDASGVSGDITVQIDWRGNTADYSQTDIIEVQIDPGTGTFATVHTYVGEDEAGAPDTGDAGFTFISTGLNSPLSGSTLLTFTPSGGGNPRINFNIPNTNFPMQGAGEGMFVDEVSFSSASGTTCVTTTTNAGGNYFFANLPADDIEITVDPNNNTLPITQINSSATGDPDSDGDNVHTFTYPGGDDLTKDWGYQPNQITGNVGLDSNGNGAADSNLSGVTVLLYTDPNDDGDPSDGELVATATTDGSGSYAFTGTPLASSGSTPTGTGVPTGDYVVVEVDPAGFKSVTDGDTSADTGGDNANVAAPLGNVDNYVPVTLASGEVDADNNFVDTATTSISGTVWLDEDLDGILDTEEAGISVVTVELRDLSNTLIATTTTDSNGDYTFENIQAGDYTVTVVEGGGTPLAALARTAGTGGTNPKSVTATLGDEVNDVDFGYIPQANQGAIGDRVWADADGDGIQDPGEAGIEGVSLILQDSSGAQVGSAVTTGPDGDYLFTGVPFADDYTVVINPADAALTGFTPTGPQPADGYESKPVSLSSTLSVVTDADFGFDNNNLNTIRDTVWLDADADGVRDGGEIGIENVTINLVDDNTDEVIATSFTDASGNVVFTGVPDGDYRLEITDNDGLLTAYNGTTPEGAARVSDPVSVSGGADVNDDSFGYNNSGSISGVVYSDADSSADQEPGEPGIGAVVVELRDSGGVVIATTMTAADGSYQFDGLAPGDYTVVVTPPAGTQTEDPDASVDNQTAVSLPLGGSSTDNDFGYNNASLNDISGTVFLDPDKDGVEDASEPGFANVSLQLQTAPLDIQNSVADINGDGLFDNNDDGLYLGYTVIDGQLDIDGDGNIDGDDDGSIDGVDIINGSFDFNGNGGVGGAGDTGTLSPVLLATTTTDSNGDYSFVGLQDGRYEVEVTDNAAILSGYDITSGLDVLGVTMAGADVADVDFGYIQDEATAALSGTVWVEEGGLVDGNGQPDQDETKLPNVDVHLCRSPLDPVTDSCDPTDPEFVATTTTDINGEYSFSGLSAGSYVTDIDLSDVPDRLEQPAALEAGPVDLAEGETVTDVNHGVIPEADEALLSGFVWVDIDGDGLFDPNEAPIAGVTIEVRDLSLADGSNPDGPIIATTTTNADGSWSIVSDDTAPDDIDIDNLLVGYDSSNLDALAGADVIEDQPTNMPVGDFQYAPVDLASDPDSIIGDLDFGFRPVSATSLGTISGTIYNDNDLSLTYGLGTDDVFQDVTLSLLDDMGNVLSTTTTDENGFYIFRGLPDGDYTVVITDHEGVTSDLNEEEVLPAVITIDVSTPATRDIVEDAGFSTGERYGSIGNRFFFDADNDGFFDDNESGIEGIVIQCWLDADNSETPDSPGTTTSAPVAGIDNLIRTVTTDENGEYNCTSLPTGQYIVVVADAGDFNELDDGATVTGNAGDGFAKPWTYAITVAPVSGSGGSGDATTGSISNLAADFGVVGDNSISGYVAIEDESLVEPNAGPIDNTELDAVPSADPNLTNTSADTPAENVTVALLVENDDGEFVVLTTTETDSNGMYSFDNLPDGDYQVRVLPEGSVIDGFGQTGDPSIAGAVDPVDRVCDSDTAALCDDTSDTIALSAGADVESINFTYQRDFTTTPVTMTTFTSYRDGDTVVFNWETSNEVGHAGFQIYQRDAEDWTLITPELIMSYSESQLSGNKYTYSVATDATWFALIDVSANEVLTAHGPFRVGEAYGSSLEAIESFDWNKVDISDATTQEVQGSVERRVLEAIDQAGEEEDGDDFTDDEFSELDDLDDLAEDGE